MSQNMKEIEELRLKLAEKDAEIERLKSSPPEKREDLRCVISDLCQQVRERDEQLAAAQLQIKTLCEAIEHTNQALKHFWPEGHLSAIEALALHTDTSALEALIAKAGEVMRERCEGVAAAIMSLSDKRRRIRALPGVTLEDLK